MSHPDEPPTTKPFLGGSDPDLSGMQDLQPTEPGNSVHIPMSEYHLGALSQPSQVDGFQTDRLGAGFAESAVQPASVALPQHPYDVPIPMPQVEGLRAAEGQQTLAVYQGAQPPAPYSPNRPAKPQHHSLLKPEHRNSKAARRGPMDEMRQLVRILVKIFPQSIQYLAITDEGGGGNRVSEEQIKDYLKATLGQGPHPEWGVPQGWGHYLAELFSWATDKQITAEVAMNCARRLPGRSWEAVEETLTKIGILPWNWPLPLTKQGIAEAGQHTMDGAGTVTVGQKRGGEELVPDWRVAGDAGAAAGPQQPPHKRRRNNRNNAGAVVSFDMSYWTELDCWHIALKCLQEARTKRNTSPQELIPELTNVKAAVRGVVLQDTQSLLEVPPQQGSSHTMRTLQPVTLQMQPTAVILQHGEMQAPNTMLSTMGPSGDIMYVSAMVPGSMADGMMPVMPMAQYQSMTPEAQGAPPATVVGSSAMVADGTGMPRVASYQHGLHPAGAAWNPQQQQQQQQASLAAQPAQQAAATGEAAAADAAGRAGAADAFANVVRPQAVRPVPSMSSDGQHKPLVGGEGSGFSPYMSRLFNSTNSSGFVRFMGSQASLGDELEQPMPNSKAADGSSRPPAGVQNLRNNLFGHLETLAGRGSQSASMQLLEGASFPHAVRTSRPQDGMVSQVFDEALPPVPQLVTMDDGTAPRDEPSISLLPGRSLQTPGNSAINSALASLAAANNFADTVDDDDDCDQEYGTDDDAGYAPDTGVAMAGGRLGPSPAVNGSAPADMTGTLPQPGTMAGTARQAQAAANRSTAAAGKRRRKAQDHDPSGGPVM